MTARSTAQTNATTIKNETVAGANTATRVGTNLKELADGTVFIEDVGVSGDMTSVTKAAASAGASGKWADAAHKHDVSTAAPATALDGATTNAEGNATSLARSNHTHALSMASAGDLAAVGTAAGAGTGDKVPRADHVHAHGDQTVDSLHALATSSAHGFQDKADKQFRDRLFTDGIRSADVISEDFDTAGAYTTAAAAVPTGVCFGRLSWRALFSGTGAALTFVTTNQDATHLGIIEFNTGTTTTGNSAAVRKPLSTSSGRIIASGQTITQEWLVRIPTLSDGTETWSLRLGWHDGGGTTGPSNGVYFEYLSGTSTNWRGITNNATTQTVASGGSNVAVAAGSWLRLTITWDGTTASFYVNGTLIGTSSTNIPTASVPESIHMLKSAGTTARTVLADYFWQNVVYTTPRAT